jgi:hypothetical protein
MMRYTLIFVCLAWLGQAAAADETSGTSSTRKMLRERLAEETKGNQGKPAPGSPPAAPPITDTAKAVAEGTDKLPVGAATPATTAATPSTDKSEAQKQPATVLPKVEVKKNRITELDRQLAKEDEAIAREKKNAKPSETDNMLNDEKIAKPLAIFGGESTQYRKQVSKQRVSLMEDEKDLLEAIAHAKTKAEKAELQKQLDALRAERRELDRAMR